MRAARALALAASRVSLRAWVRTRRGPVRVGVAVAVLRLVARRADGLRAAALRFAAGFLAAAGLLVEVFVVVLVVSAMWLFPLTVRSDLCSPQLFRRTYVRKPKSWTGYNGVQTL